MKRISLRYIILCLIAAVSLFEWHVMKGVDKAMRAISSHVRVRKILLIETEASVLSTLVDKYALQEYLGLDTGLEVFSIDSDALTRKLKKLPFIKSAEIEKNSFGTVRIHYSFFEPRGITINRHKPWMVSREGLLISPIEDILKWRNQYPGEAKNPGRVSGIYKSNFRVSDLTGLPVFSEIRTNFVEKNSYIDCVAFVESLEKYLGDIIAEVHSVNVESSETIKSHIEVHYEGFNSKIEIIGTGNLTELQGRRLRRVIEYLVEHRVLARSIDLRPGKKVVVNVSKNT